MGGWRQSVEKGARTTERTTNCTSAKAIKADGIKARQTGKGKAEKQKNKDHDDKKEMKYEGRWRKVGRRSHMAVDGKTMSQAKGESKKRRQIIKESYR